MVSLFFGLLLAVSAYARTDGPPPSIESIRASIRDKNIRTVEEFVAELPADLLANYTLMYRSKSLHGASEAEPRAILFGSTGQYVVAFNGSTSQASGASVEFMLYDSAARTYGFHELDFSTGAPVLRESPSKCFACHGSKPRPIWDHYNSWPGAYGGDDDRYRESEYSDLQSFITHAADHPRYKFLAGLAEGYGLSAPGTRGGLTERTEIPRNREMTMVLYRAKIEEVARAFLVHPDYPKIKGLLFYFLTKCYLPADDNRQGDGVALPESAIRSYLDALKAGALPKGTVPFQPDRLLDLVYRGLGGKTEDWYLSARDLPSAQSLSDGTDRLNEAFLFLLLEGSPEFREFYELKSLDFRIRSIPMAFVKNKSRACQALSEPAIEGGKFLRSPTPRPTRSYGRVLPQICLKCHTQTPGGEKVYLPFQEFPERAARGDTVLIEKMRQAITISMMPMRTSGDSEAFRRYRVRDYPKLKSYLDDLMNANFGSRR